MCEQAGIIFFDDQFSAGSEGEGERAFLAYISRRNYYKVIS